MNQKIKLFLYFASVFVVFTIVVLVEHQRRENQFARSSLVEKLDIYSNIAQRDTLSENLPSDLRITIIGSNGRVSYDNGTDSTQKFDNHFSRPEIAQAKQSGVGSDIRVSQTTGKKYLYYARKTGSGYIRVALPFSSTTESLLSTNKTFLIVALILFIVALLFLWVIARKFGGNMMRLDRAVSKNKVKQEQFKADMTSSIAHELRTPIATIRSYTETLLDNELTEEERRRFTERTHSAAIRLTELIRDISLLSKLDEKARLFDKEPVDLRSMVDQIEQEFAPLAKENSVSVENRLPTELKIRANSTLVHSIFANLIENSIKYGGKWITVRVELVGQSNEKIDFRISDTGIGIEAGHLKHIFQRFYRVDTGRSRSDGGSGLGLAIVRHAVLYHGGQISASVAQGGGLVIDFSLSRD